jgi:hypothetical protein
MREVRGKEMAERTEQVNALLSEERQSHEAAIRSRDSAIRVHSQPRKPGLDTSWLTVGRLPGAAIGERTTAHRSGQALSGSEIKRGLGVSALAESSSR